MTLHQVQRIHGWSSLEMLAKKYGHQVPELAMAEVQRLHELLEPRRWGRYDDRESSGSLSS